MKKSDELVAGNGVGTRFLIENRRWQDAGGKLQNSQIKLDMLPSVDKTC